jgi:hypothetical protein
MTEEKDKVGGALRASASNLLAFYDSLFVAIRTCITEGEEATAHRLVDRVHDLIHIMDVIKEGLYRLKEAEGRNE